jgi:hypothetical protein
MPNSKALSAVLILVPAAFLLMSHSSIAESASDDCKTQPGGSAPGGMHWYYRIDRANNRRCWYLHAQGLPVHARADLKSQNQADDEDTAAEPLPARSTVAVPRPLIQQLSNPQQADPATAPPQASIAGPAALNFAERWLDLPKSMDLDRREITAPSTAYAAEHPTADARQQLPASWAGVSTVDDEAKTNSDQSSFGSLSFAGAAVLLLLFISEALVKVAGAFVRKARQRLIRADFTVDDEAPNRTCRPTVTASDARRTDMGLSELQHALRRADAGVQPPQSFAPRGSIHKHAGRSVRSRRQVQTRSAFQRLKTRSFGPRWAPL